MQQKSANRERNQHGTSTPAATERTVWFANALQSLSPEEREATLASRRRQLRPRDLKQKIPMLTTVWATLAITGLYPVALPDAPCLPGGSARSRMLHAAIGVAGLGGVEMLKRAVGRANMGRFAEGRRGALKALTYVAICLWTFLLSQLVSGTLLGEWRV